MTQATKTSEQNAPREILPRPGREGHLPLRLVAEMMDKAGVTTTQIEVKGVKYNVTKEA